MASQPAKVQVTSSFFADGETIPPSAAHEMAGGDNISPDLAWTGVPSGTASLALTCYDPDAPTTVGFTHWILFNLDPSLTGLESGAGADGQAPAGSVQGFTDWGQSHYGGMAPPQEDDAHRYIFTVYALDVAQLEAGPTTTYALFHFMIRGHVLAQGTLTGLFAAS